MSKYAVTKEQTWQAMSKESKSFLQAMIKAGLTVRAIKTSVGLWRK